MKSKLAPLWRSKIVIGAFILGMLVGALIMLRWNEDSWLCEDGQWVMHGHPFTAMPLTPCD